MSSRDSHVLPDAGAAPQSTSSRKPVVMAEPSAPQMQRPGTIPAGVPAQRPLPLKDIPAPAEVTEAVEKTVAQETWWLRRWMRPRIAEAFKFQYLFGGKTVAYVDGKEGREVIALDDEIPKALASLDSERRKRVVIAFPSPWPTDDVESVTPPFDEHPADAKDGRRQDERAPA